MNNTVGGAALLAVCQLALPTIFRSALLATIWLVTGSTAMAQMGGPAGGVSASGKNLTGLWERSRGYSAGVILTEAGLARTEGLTVMDDPEVFCEGYNVPRTSFASNTAVRMAEFPDRLEIYYEHNAAERVIYLDGETRTEATRMLGTSSGRREGNTIVIETDSFPDGLAHGATLVTSDELKFLERYTLRPDGDTIEVLLMAVDPQTYEWPRISHAFWTRLPEDTFFYPSECEYDPEVHVPYYDPALLESSYIDPAED